MSIVTIVIGLLSFRCDECPVEYDSPCGPVALSGGLADEFSDGNSEAASLHPDFQALLETRENPVEPNFDGVTTNRHFGHSLLFPECSGDRTVKSARLTMRLKALKGDAGTDQTHWYIRNDQGELQHVWGALIPRDLSDGTWSPGEAQTFVFDLATMPVYAPNSYANLLPYLENGELHVHVQDDTSVDFIKLEIVTCCEGDRNPEQ